MATVPVRVSPSLPAAIAAALLLLLIWGGLFTFIEHDRRITEENAYHQAQNYATAFEEHARNIVATVDNSLLYLRQLYSRSLSTNRPIDSYLIEGYAPLQTFQFSVIGPDGILLFSNLNPASSRVDLSDREHFRVHVGTPDDRLFISRPVLGRVSGKWSIQFTRKIILPDGRFGGVLVLSVEKRAFEDFFERVDIGPRGLIALFGQDGWMRARGTRVPETRHDSSKDPLPRDRPYFDEGAASNGRVITPGFYDGIRRMGTYRRVRGVPLVVTVQLAFEDVFAEHLERSDKIISVGLLISLATAIGWAFFAVLRHQRDAAVQDVALSEQRWRLALDKVGDGVWDWNPQSGAMFFSQQMQVISGVPPEGLPRSQAEWLQTLHPDDRDGVAADFDAFMAGAPRFYREYRLRCGDGSYKWVLDRAAVTSRDARGIPLRIIGLRSDIAERRQLEEQLARRNEEMRALEAAFAAREIDVARHRLSEAQKVARLGIIERNGADGRWSACDHARMLLGLAPAVSYAPAELLAAATPQCLAAAQPVLARPPGALNMELHIQTESGLRYLRAVGCAAANAGEPDFVTLQDISSHRAAEIEHDRLKERMEEANRMESLGTLAGGIAHEINTPAQFVGDNLAFLERGVGDLLALAGAAAQGRAEDDWSGMASMLDGMDLDFLTKEMPEAVAQGIEGIARIAKIVQAVKEFCYPSSRERRPCDLNHMIESAATVTRNTWKLTAEMDLDLDPALPRVSAIEGEINQVLVNLIVNAAQAIAERKDSAPGRITIRTRAEGEQIRLSVADTGIGIPADRHKRIFELFYTTKPPGQGTGQGLAITNAIVHRHGGTIEVASRPGEGACFTIALPLGPQDEEP